MVGSSRDVMSTMRNVKLVKNNNKILEAMDEFVSNFVIDIIQNIEAVTEIPPRRRRDLPEDVFELRDSEVKKHFRLDKDLIKYVIELIAPVILDTSKLDLQTKVLSTLHFLATGSYQTPTGNLNRINISQPSTSRCISDVVEALNHPSIFNEWVRFPRNIQELNVIAREFFRLYGFPGVIGCIDCTHVAIVPPAGPSFDESIYVNRKNYHSINTQLICDSSLKILNVNALFPGSTHDSYIWNNSAVLPILQNMHSTGYNTYHLLGDSGYPLRPWCLTPILDTEEGSPAFLYSEALKKTRSIIERCNGVLKGRFRCLLKDRVLHYSPNKATKIINACCVLHNICVAHNIDEPDDMPNYRDLGFIDLPSPSCRSASDRGNIFLLQGREKQQQIINNYFTQEQ